MKNIYFHIDELNRDPIVASALYFKLKNKFNFYFGNRAYSPLLKHFDIFDIYIFPNVETLEQALDLQIIVKE